MWPMPYGSGCRESAALKINSNITILVLSKHKNICCNSSVIVKKFLASCYNV